jgi:hypothetical protein
MNDAAQDQEVNYDDYTVTELAELMVGMKSQLDNLNRAKADLQKRYDKVRLQVIPNKMEDMGVTSMNITGVGRLGVTSDIEISVLAEDRDRVYEWLREQGHGDLVNDYVWPQTLKALVKEQIREGNEIDDHIKITPFARASITRT